MTVVSDRQSLGRSWQWMTAQCDTERRLAVPGIPGESRGPGIGRHGSRHDHRAGDAQIKASESLQPKSTHFQRAVGPRSAERLAARAADPAPTHHRLGIKPETGTLRAHQHGLPGVRAATAPGPATTGTRRRGSAGERGRGWLQGPQIVVPAGDRPLKPPGLAGSGQLHSFEALEQREMVLHSPRARQP